MEAADAVANSAVAFVHLAAEIMRFPHAVVVRMFHVVGPGVGRVWIHNHRVGEFAELSELVIM